LYYPQVTFTQYPDLLIFSQLNSNNLNMIQTILLFDEQWAVKNYFYFWEFLGIVAYDFFLFLATC